MKELNDQDLNTPAQIQISELLKALPDDTVSMAWRSSLNTRLRAESVRRKKLNLFGWIWKPAAGLALAGALALTFIMRPGAVMPSADSGVERALVNAHIDSTASWEVAADGATASEVKDSAQTLPVDWDQEDVGATL